MAEKTRHEPGTFCWVELGTSDGPAAKRFYASLFGWTWTDFPGRAGPYTILQKNGKDAAALYQMGAQQGVPPNWASYVRVESADDAAARAKGLGAKVLMGPFDAAENGRMAVLQDPTGAFFSIWEPRANPGAGVVNEPGAFCWNELYTPDPKAAGDFYSRLFGWTREAMPLPTGQEYTIFKKGDAQVAGMMELPKEWKVPPHWLVYFAVDDSDRTVRKASGMGAKVMMPPTDIPNVGRFAILNDPQGADFAVIHMKAPSQS